ncbi:magnesium transporter NIPA-domain-containing protein [Chytridium lagenaria]|nr:magnesium transporter NIPA-domain-containing protein [Chytridium lagenaria]
MSTPSVDVPSWYGVVDSQAIAKKKGTLDEHGNTPAGEYLKNPLWWSGLLLMAIGEGANFAAYGFVPAILVTPLGAVSVVVSAVLASIFLKERLSFSREGRLRAMPYWLHHHRPPWPTQSQAETLPDFLHFVIQPGFLAYAFISVFVLLYLIYYVAPRYGKENPIVYLSICSILGRLWLFAQKIYPLMVFMIFTILSEIHFLNKALHLFSTAVVTPVYYVFFTTSTMVSSTVLFRGFPVASVQSGITVLFGFLTIVGGVALLQSCGEKQPKDIDDADMEEGFAPVTGMVTAASGAAYGVDGADYHGEDWAFEIEDNNAEWDANGGATRVWGGKSRAEMGGVMGWPNGKNGDLQLEENRRAQMPRLWKTFNRMRKGGNLGNGNTSNMIEKFWLNVFGYYRVDRFYRSVTKPFSIGFVIRTSKDAQTPPVKVPVPAFTTGIRQKDVLPTAPAEVAVSGFQRSAEI